MPLPGALTFALFPFALPFAILLGVALGRWSRFWCSACSQRSCSGAQVGEHGEHPPVVVGAGGEVELGEDAR